MRSVLLVFGCLFFSSQASAATFDCKEIKDSSYTALTFQKLKAEKAVKLWAAKDYDNYKKSLRAADDALEHSAQWATLYIAFCKN